MAKRIQRTSPAPKRTGPAASAQPAAKRSSRGGRVNAGLVTDFTVQLATLSDAGIPVVKALTILEGQTDSGPFKEVLREITEDVSGGAPLSDAMAKHDRVFDDLYTSMVRAGEVGGVLDRVLERLAEFREKAADIRSKVTQAVIYPAILIVLSIGVIAAVIVFVIPTFNEIFTSFDVDLPEPTQILLGLSAFVTKYWYLVFGLPILLLVLHRISVSRNRGYRRWWHAVLLKIPFLGSVINRSITASFARTFGTLVQAGVPHLDALEIVRDASGNEVLVDAVEDIRRTVREGEGIARPMGETGLFDDVVTNMVDVGEETGELDAMLLRVADAYDQQVDRRLAALFKVLEPAILVMMAVLIGALVVSLILPLTKMMSTIGGQA
ncbi:MAG: type II secretion system F family protein [Planctomycetota bacterium]